MTTEMTDPAPVGGPRDSARGATRAGRSLLGRIFGRLAVLLAAGGCAVQSVPPATIPDVVDCSEIRKEVCDECGKFGSSGTDRETFLSVGVMIHLMRARGIDDRLREALQDQEPAWKVAPRANAVRLAWTPAIDPILSKANQIWQQAKIRLVLLRADNCDYEPRLLRLDGRLRESMFTPESQIPWAPELFRSINRLFTTAHARVVHVVVWWSLMEDDAGFAKYGYGRSAAYGGPAAWTDAYQCLRHPADPSGTDLTNYTDCGRLLAHEIGHAFGLQHVDDMTNLMHPGWAEERISEQQAEQVRREARQQFTRK